MMEDLGNQYLSQVSDSLHSVVQLTSRIDERVQHIVEKQKEQDARFSSLMEAQTTLLARIAVLESKNGHAQSEHIEELKTKVHELELVISKLEMRSESMENKWSKVLDFTFKILFVIVSCYVVYKLNIPTPSIL